MNIATNVSPLNVLLVEDNPGDVRLMKEALQEDKLVYNLHVVWDGEEAMDFLLQKGDFTQSPRPDLILLDLNLPRKDGREVLREVKNDPALKHIPVVILTCSQAEQDILKTYELHANCYITKPVNLEQFTTVVKSIKEFWFTIVRLPKG